MLEVCQCIGLQHAAKVRDIHILWAGTGQAAFQRVKSFPPAGGALKVMKAIS